MYIRYYHDGTVETRDSDADDIQEEVYPDVWKPCAKRDEAPAEEAAPAHPAHPDHPDHSTPPVPPPTRHTPRRGES